ncbi:MAG: TlpA family protein disulfide reductase [Ferruginibacter sp.]|nr:TlpA family protein disulfide reductase [Ferruginibacter sp.]
MKTHLFLVLLLCRFSGFGQSSWSPVAPVNSQLLPHFSTSIDSIVYSNESLKGKVVYINFWYAACPPCMAEFDALNDLYKKIKDKKNLVFLSMTFEPSDVIAMLVEKFKIRYPILSFPDAELKKLNFGKGFPTSLVIDAEGKVVYVRTGGSSDKKEARKLIMKEIYPAILKNL